MIERQDQDKTNNPETAVKKQTRKDWKLELSALIGFCLSGGLFIASGIRNGDVLTIAGSLVWILSCIVWLMTYRKYFNP